MRRVSGYGAGLLAGAVLALTPVAALMFRFNNPDALLVLLLVVAGYCVTRALDGASTRWVALAGAAVGFAFLAKLLQALLITPALALVVLVAMPGSVRQRLRDLAVGVLAMLVSAGWYLALVEPVAQRLSALYRRLDGQQPAAVDAGLQRAGAGLRWRRQSRRRLG